MLIVTAIDRPYLPGLKALHNSYKANSPNLDFACMVYGDDELAAEVRDRGIEVVQNVHLNVKLPTTWRHPVESEPMYARLIAPRVFQRDVVWMDADQVILKPLDELATMDFQGFPCAAVPATPMDRNIKGLPEKSPSGKRWDQIPGIYSGLLPMRFKEWTEQRVMERCFEVMERNEFDFYYVVQSVLGYVLEGKFHHLSPDWQRFGNRTHAEIDAETKVIHWHGHGRNPWTYPMRNIEHWEKYA